MSLCGILMGNDSRRILFPLSTFQLKKKNRKFKRTSIQIFTGFFEIKSEKGRRRKKAENVPYKFELVVYWKYPCHTGRVFYERHLKW